MSWVRFPFESANFFVLLENFCINKILPTAYSDVDPTAYSGVDPTAYSGVDPSVAQ